MTHRLELPSAIFATTSYGYTWRVNEEPLCEEYAARLARELTSRFEAGGTTYEVRGFWWRKK